jgi:hypothetical protein
MSKVYRFLVILKGGGLSVPAVLKKQNSWMPWGGSCQETPVSFYYRELGRFRGTVSFQTTGVDYGA